MFGDYVFETASAQYEKKILLIDADNLEEQTHYSETFRANGFEVATFEDDLSFRIKYTRSLNDNSKLLVLAKSNAYIPYDIQKKCRKTAASYEALFPYLNSAVLRDAAHSGQGLDLDLLSNVYRTDFETRHERAQTEDLLAKMYLKENLEPYLASLYETVLAKAKTAARYTDWLTLAEAKAKIDVAAAEHGVDIDTSDLNRLFCDYAMKNFGAFSSEVNKNGPVLVSDVMEYMHENSKRFAVIVMDGMSEFDWAVIRRSFGNLNFSQRAVFAMIPTTTSVSRQCLLSGKYPKDLYEPWKQSKEKTEFYECAAKLGYSDRQIGYERGYDAEFSPFVSCGAVIILDIDDAVHAQQQGRAGMFRDDELFMKQGKLANLTRRLLGDGFDVYITSDHGNTTAVGLGRLTRAGVELETKSRRMLVLKNYADKNALIEKYRMLEYPKYYLPKEYDYLICSVGDSMDIQGDHVMTHGGISLDEAVVPFIALKAVDYNG